MKTHVNIFIVAIGALSLLSAKAQTNGDEASKAFIFGAWQRCVFQQGDSGQYQIRVLPIIRTVAEGGSFHDIVVSSEGGSCGIAASGKLEKQNDSTLVERLTAVGENASDKAEPTTLQYRLQGPQWLVIERPGGPDGKSIPEFWMRLRQLPDAQKAIESMLSGKPGPQGGERGPRMGRPGGQNGRPQGANRRGNGQNRQQFQQNNQQFQNNDADNSWMNEE